MSDSRRHKNVLPIVVCFLVLSGTLRLAFGIGPAIAIAEDAVEIPAAPETEEGVEIDPLLAALQAREHRVGERETAIEDRLIALSAAEEELTKRLEELEAAEQSLMAALALSETANDADIARLTAVYENMKPADAAGLFEQMDPAFASGFLVRMRPDAAAAIMTGLEPQTAYTVSVIIAGRNADAPVE